jgi:hypothetical protein
MAKRIGGTPLPETYVVSACLERGLDALEAELWVKGKRRRTPANHDGGVRPRKRFRDT